MFYWMDFEVDYNRISFRIVLAMTKIENSNKKIRPKFRQKWKVDVATRAE